jgi:hypothetical protein
MGRRYCLLAQVRYGLSSLCRLWAWFHTTRRCAIPERGISERGFVKPKNPHDGSALRTFRAPPQPPSNTLDDAEKGAPGFEQETWPAVRRKKARVAPDYQITLRMASAGAVRAALIAGKAALARLTRNATTTAATAVGRRTSM